MRVPALSSSNAFEFELANGDRIRLGFTAVGVVGELVRKGNCLTQSRFVNFAAAGEWIDAEVRLAAASWTAGEAAEGDLGSRIYQSIREGTSHVEQGL